MNIYIVIKKPAYQALLFFLLTPISIFLLQPKNADMAWLVAVYLFIMFLVVNAGLLWFDNNPWRYFFHSISFIVAYVLIIAFTMPGLLSLLKLKGSGESAMGFLFLIYQPAVLFIIMFAKWIATKWF